MRAWIETTLRQCSCRRWYIALFMRAWIETLSVITPPAWRSVALFMRAWIETWRKVGILRDELVALFMRAWIETVVMKTIMSFHRRRPLHEGVDWNARIRRYAAIWWHVALFMRAWIETPIFATVNGKSFSRPLHEGVDWNGLDIFEGGLSAWSPSSWGRGLKCHVLRYTESCRQVALFMRAWIEIIDLNTYSIHENSRPLHEGVDWNFTIGQEYHNDVVALFTRAWIEMNYLICVKHTYDVALFTRAWIEIILSRKSSVYPFVALFMRAWIEISTSDMIFLLFCSRPLVVCHAKRKKWETTG